jgi:hypothetical protein
MVFRVIIVFSIILVIVLILIIPIIYLSFKNNKPSNVNISQGQDPHRKMCHSYPVRCDGESEDFCSRTCLDNMEYSCQEVPTLSYNQDKKPQVNKGKKYCLPEGRAKEYPCDIKKGCVPTWTGWGDTNRMEWDSLCMYPDYFGGNGCSPTPGVCTLNGMNFMPDKDYSEKPPTFEDCKNNFMGKLPEEIKNDFTVIKRENNETPIIVKRSQCLFYRDVSPTENRDVWPQECKS